MIEKVFVNTWAQERYRVGPVAQHSDSFAAFMLERGHSVENVRSQFGLIRDINRWLIRRRLSLKVFNDPESAARFLKHRRQRVSRLTFRRDRYAFYLFLEHLQKNGILKAPKVKSLSETDRLIQRFSHYLINERGLSESSHDRYCGLARELLATRGKKIRLKELKAKDIYSFTLSYSRRVSPKTAGLAVSALRSFLRFLCLNGLIVVDLAEHVPTIPNRKNAELPRYLEPEAIRTIVESCDRSTATGKRNYAILLILARFGLRACEVRALTLDDIDWQSGMITVRGKGQRLNKFPLPKDVGVAIVEYIKTARPKSSSRHLFLSTRAPIREITNSASISSIVHRTIMNTSLRPPYRGAHVFRHSLGTQVLRSGASLREVGHLLRHRGLNTTAIYAKVDFKGLNQVALLWPGITTGGAK